MDEKQVGKKRRARRTGKEVQRLVEEFISGGMKRSDFCRSRGLSLGTLRRHLEGGKQGARQTPRLVAVELEEKAIPKANAIEAANRAIRQFDVAVEDTLHELAMASPKVRTTLHWFGRRARSPRLSGHQGRRGFNAVGRGGMKMQPQSKLGDPPMAR
jgi:hypothetical protein